MHDQKNYKQNKRSQAKKGGFKKGTVIKIVALLTVLLTLASCTTKEENYFRVGMECGYSPYNWTQLDNSNNAVRIEGTNQYANGYDVQIAKRIADELGKELLISKVAWEGLIPSLESGKIDAIAAGMSATDERKESIDFSDLYYYSDLVVVVKKDSKFAQANSIEDLSGAKLTGQLGTTHYTVIDQVPNVDKHPALADFPNMIVALQAGSIDGYVSEKPGALSASMANPDITYIEFPEGNGFQFDEQEVSIGVGIKKGNPILPEVNAAINKISQEERQTIMEEAIKNQPSEEGERLSFFPSFINILKRYWPHFLRGAGTTLVLSIIGTLIGLIIGLMVATFRLTPPNRNSKGVKKALHSLVSFLLSAYVEIIRGTPMMVQSMVFYYGNITLFGDNLSPFVAGVIILSINTGAYMSEVVRGGIESVDKGQTEAGMAIGMTHKQTMRSIVLPQAIRNILPATGNEFVINIKDTSVFNVIAVTELYFATRDVQANTLRPFETYLITGIIYFILTFTVTNILRAVERKMDGPSSYALTSSSMPATVDLHQKQGGN